MDGLVIDLRPSFLLCHDLTFDHLNQLGPLTANDCILKAFCKTRLEVTNSYRLELWCEVRHPSNQCPQFIWGQPILPTNNAID